MGDFFSFRRMITPVLIQIAYWLGSIVIVLAGVGVMAGLLKSVTGGGFLDIIGGLIIIVGGLVGWRVMCEGIILSFRINETLTDVRNALTHGAAPVAPQAVPPAYTPPQQYAQQYPSYPQYPQAPQVPPQTPPAPPASSTPPAPQYPQYPPKP